MSRPDHPDLPRIPETLDEAVDQIVSSMSEQDRDGWRTSVDGWQARLHHGFGTALRNDWGLWFNHTPIARWFQSRGIWMGDDRSGVLLDAVHRRLKGLPIDEAWVREQEVYYDAYWADKGLGKEGKPL